MERSMIGLTVLALVFCACPAFATTIGSAMDTPENLVANMLGSGVTFSNVSYTGSNLASGYFTGGVSAGIGMESGILLTSGFATNVTDSNTSDGITGENYLAGDSDLDGLIPGFTTLDATVLEFDFQLAAGETEVYFNYVFGSEEYNEYTNNVYNDVFGFFFEGANIALIPGTSTPVAINTVNGGNPLGTDESNPHLYNNNDDGNLPFEYDGFTNVFTAQATGLTPEQDYHIKLAIADAGDSILDSGVFIQAGTFSTKLLPVVPEPASIVAWCLIGLSSAGISWQRRRKA